MANHCFIVAFVFFAISLFGNQALAESPRQESVRDRLWIWGHPAGVYNNSYLKGVTRKSTIQPGAAAKYMGIRNMIFVRYEGQPQPPFEKYYRPFKKLDRVYWSLVGASGVTSGRERQQVYKLAEGNDNVAGFILDDFFHESATEDRDLWLAENNVAFPVTVTITAPPTLVPCDTLKLVQSNWKTGDYRSNDFEIELSSNGKDFKQVSKGALPDRAAASVTIAIPNQKFAALRIRILSTHDTKGAISCGLKAIELYSAGTKQKLEGAKVAASSSYSGFHAVSLVGGVVPFRASLSPKQLQDLASRKVRGKKLPIMAVVYTGQISRRAKAHLDQVDQVCMWTWRPENLKQLETNLTALEKLVRDKPIFLGCYMYDFASGRPLQVEQMKWQTEFGYKWLRQGRVDGMIFLATPNVDVDLEAVEWTRKWIAKFGDEPLVEDK
jgi:hypothetical protein